MSDATIFEVMTTKPTSSAEVVLMSENFSPVNELWTYGTAFQTTWWKPNRSKVSREGWTSVKNGALLHEPDVYKYNNRSTFIGTVGTAA